MLSVPLIAFDVQIEVHVVNAQAMLFTECSLLLAGHEMQHALGAHDPAQHKCTPRSILVPCARLSYFLG